MKEMAFSIIKQLDILCKYLILKGLVLKLFNCGTEVVVCVTALCNNIPASSPWPVSLLGYGHTFFSGDPCKHCWIMAATAIPVHFPNPTGTSVGDNAVANAQLSV